MPVPDAPPPYVERARDREERYRAQAEADWDKYLESRPPRPRKLTQWEELVAIKIASGDPDWCPTCSSWAPARDGVHECCGKAWES